MKSLKFIAQVPRVLIALTFDEAELNDLEAMLIDASSYGSKHMKTKENLLKLITEAKEGETKIAEEVPVPVNPADDDDIPF